MGCMTASGPDGDWVQEQNLTENGAPEGAPSLTSYLLGIIESNPSPGTCSKAAPFPLAVGHRATH